MLSNDRAALRKLRQIICYFEPRRFRANEYMLPGPATRVTVYCA